MNRRTAIVLLAVAGLVLLGQDSIWPAKKVWIASLSANLATLIDNLALADKHGICDLGVFRGGGLDSDTGLYDWTCGNYNWTSVVGGTQVSAGDGSTISDYDEPTTDGGNSWPTTCDSDGQGTPDTVEETPCLHAGEILNNYAGNDMMLAADNTRPGGEIYLPEGLYVIQYCGQQANGDPNGCPVLQHSPGHYQRMVSMWGGRELIGEGQDPDGPHENGRTGTWLILAGGDDLDGDGDLEDDICDRNGDGWCASPNGMVRVGGDISGFSCQRQDGTGGCKLTVASTDADVVPLGTYGRTFAGAILDLDLNVGNNSAPVACLDNDNGVSPFTTGSCSEDRSIRCTLTSGGRLGLNTGDCVIDDTAIGGGIVDLGTCEPLVSALWTDMKAQEALSTTAPTMHFTIQTNYPQHRGLASEVTTANMTALARIGAFDNSGNITGAALGTCKGTGKYVYLTAPLDADKWAHPSVQPIWNAGVQPTFITILDWEKFNNDGGGLSHLNMMNAHWRGRDSANDAADCDTYQDGGTQDDSVANSACDSMGYLHLGAGWKGHVRHVSTWYGGGDDDAWAYSLIDGNTGGLAIEFGWNSVNQCDGLITDASGWYYHDNVYRDCHGDSVMFVSSYAPGAYVERDRFINISGSYGFYLNGAPGFFMRDMWIEGSNFGTGMFNLLGARQAIFSNIAGFGNRGTVWLLGPTEGKDTWDVVVEHVNLAGHGTYEGGGNAKPQGLIVAWDNDGNQVGGTAENVTFRDHHYQVSADADICMIWLGGGIGDESSAEDGLGRTVDDYRHQLNFERISVERVANTTVEGSVPFFCLGNATALEQAPDESFGNISDARGGIPRFVGLSVDGQYYPGNPHYSVRVADAVLDGGDDVDEDTEIITFAHHGLRDRDAITYDEVALGGTGGLVDDTMYFVRYESKDEILLYASRDIADDDYCTAPGVPHPCCTGSGTGTCTGPMGLTDDADGTFTLFTGFEPDASKLPQGTPVRIHSATSEGDCTADGGGGTSNNLLDGGGDFNALCKVDENGAWVIF